MLIFVIPAYNEEQNVARLLDETHVFATGQNLCYRLIVVDDGSVDHTAEIVRERSSRYPCEVVRYTPNQGVAQAFRQGFLKALERISDDDYIVTIEADRTGDLGILNELLDLMRSGCDVALASCYAKDGRIENASWVRLVLSRAANALISVFFPMKGIHTYSSFYRVYNPRVLKKVQSVYGDFYEEKGFACVIELLVRISRLGGQIAEVPMVLRSQNRRGKSKMKILPTIFGYFRVIYRNAFTRPKS